MRKVVIYRFRKYDISSDEYCVSRRWATLDAIKSVGGEPMKETATEVDISVVDTDILGMTARNFDPHRRAGFQTVVTS